MLKGVLPIWEFLQPISACHGLGTFSKVVIDAGGCIQLCWKGNWIWAFKQGDKQLFGLCFKVLSWLPAIATFNDGLSSERLTKLIFSDDTFDYGFYHGNRIKTTTDSTEKVLLIVVDANTID